MFVRLAIDTDEDDFVELARIGAAEGLSYVEFKEEKVRATFQRYLLTASPTIFVVDDKRDVIAFLLATMSNYRFADGLFTTQEVLFVRPDKRGTRAAALLVKELVRWSTQLGAIEITGGNDNKLFTETTARLLEKFGFERVGLFMRRLQGAGHG